MTYIATDMPRTAGLKHVDTKGLPGGARAEEYLDDSYRVFVRLVERVRGEVLYRWFEVEVEGCGSAVRGAGVLVGR